MIDQVNGQAPPDSSREDVELLLPWYINGTLSASDVMKVEAYLEHHPDMQVQLATLREDMDETITANETIAGPSGPSSSAALDRLMQQIEAETPVRHRVAKAKQGVMAAVDEFLRSLSPGRLGWTAMAAAAVILLQAGVVGTMMLSPPSGGTIYQTASGGNQSNGMVFLVQFKRDASFGDITAFLAEQDASIVSGPNDGLFKVRVKAEKSDDETRQALLAKLGSNDKLISTVLPSQ